MKSLASYLRTAWNISVIGGVTIGLTPAALAAFASGKDADWGHEHMRRLWSGAALKGCGIRAEARGLEHLTPGQAYIFVSNHSSEWDWYLFTFLIPFNWRAVIRADLRNFPVGGPMAAKTGQIFLPPRAGFAELREICSPVLESGRSLLLYPEGKRPAPGTLAPFKPGAFELACACGVPVAPIAVAEEYPARARGPLGRGFGHDPGRVVLAAGRPIAPRENSAGEAARLREESWEQIAGLIGSI